MEFLCKLVHTLKAELNILQKKSQLSNIDDPGQSHVVLA